MACPIPQGGHNNQYIVILNSSFRITPVERKRQLVVGTGWMPEYNHSEIAQQLT